MFFYGVKYAHGLNEPRSCLCQTETDFRGIYIRESNDLPMYFRCFRKASIYLANQYTLTYILQLHNDHEHGEWI